MASPSATLRHADIASKQAHISLASQAARKKIVHSALESCEELPPSFLIHCNYSQPKHPWGEQPETTS
ncbi:g1159 [Coccomyxa elongata]